MNPRILFAATAIALALPAVAHASDEKAAERFEKREASDGVPAQLDPSEREAYRAVFAAIRAQRWADAQLRLDSMRPGLLHATARAELYLAKGSPRAELPQLLALLGEAPELPQAEQIARLARTRGAIELPGLPVAQRMIWYDAPPARIRHRSTPAADSAAMRLVVEMQPLIKADDATNAETLLESRSAELAPEVLTEWRQRVAWMYYTTGRDADARRVAAKAQVGQGEFAPLADWVQGLAAWRQKDCAAAQAAFTSVAQRAGDTEKRTAGLYWASRADMACGRPDLVSTRLKSAAQHGETFYGLLARQALGMKEVPARTEKFVSADWKTIERRPNVRVATALVEIGEDSLAAEVIKHQARIGDAREHAALTRLAGRLALPAIQLWLTHNCPPGAQPLEEARYPAPNWTPDGGWRIDKSLVFAHTLQESRFNRTVESPAGAYGLMQIKSGAAIDVGRRRGVTIGRGDLSRPSTNMEVGQSYIEQLRDQPFTGGLLPKVIAAYNAGPTPVTNWNYQIRDNGDPLLYIESIPYWETRGYVMTVLRNYWMYEKNDGRESASRAAIAQGLWPKVPGRDGGGAVRMQASAASVASTIGAN
ncbi:lytic transglycosylase domain-containing protein [Sphingomonas sp. BT-65]|uniref:lytic transglycosylase domain-containing protein n=1 Tax=Sphingomonas sp. BT-65 TaxID=2989821 RepID=UPI002235C7A8|nr:lytic transglycosylase domain-containing protein [Sphingomonas sp. BT-65]MCW4460325.1 lytic transglycosylase domain-containing protein [Sphingomonas sp. BT-65]